MKCQKCHATLVEGYPDRFRCGSYITQFGHFQEAGVSGTCISRQRDNLEARVVELEVALMESLTWIKEMADSGDAGFFPVENIEGYKSWKAVLEDHKPPAGAGVQSAWKEVCNQVDRTGEWKDFALRLEKAGNLLAADGATERHVANWEEVRNARP